jgi:hypothetical protein
MIMKKMFHQFLIAGGIAALTSATSVQAQLQLPQPSPSASVTQTVGLTDITIEYSSPGAKGRAIYGGLVPYGKVWRTGANASTKISFSKDVTINNTKVPKGKYAIVSIPGQNEFTFILTKDLSVNEGSYKQEDDVVRVVSKPQSIEMRERMTFLFSNFTDQKTNIDLEWEKTRVSFTVNVDTDAQAMENIKSELGRTWRLYNAAARYHLDNNKELEQGMAYADQSISLKEEWFNTWTKAQLYHAMNRQADAYKFAMKAKELGDKSSSFFFKDQVEKAINDWKPAAGAKGKK